MLLKQLKIFLANGKNYLIGSFFIRAYSFLAFSFYLTILSPGDFGKLAISDTVIALLSTTMCLCLDRSLTRYYYSWRKGERNANLTAIWLVSLISCILFAIFFYSLSFFYFKKYNNNDGVNIIVTYAVLISAFRAHSLLPLMFLRIRDKSQQYSTYTFFWNFSSSVIILFLVLNEKNGAISYIKSLLINEILWFFIWFHLISKNLDKPNWNIIPKALRYSLPMVPSDFFYSLGSNLDKLILSKFINYNDLGIYSVSTKIAKVILEINGSIKNSWIPLVLKIASEINRKLSNLDKNEILNKIGFLYFVFLMYCGIGIGLFSENLLSYLNGGSFIASAKYIPLNIAIYFSVIIATIILPSVNLAEKNTSILKASFVLFVLNGLLMIPLWRSFGIYGVILSNGISLAAYASILINSKDKNYPINFLNIPVTVLFLICLALISLLSDFSSIYSLYIKCFSFMVLGFILLIYLKRELFNTNA